MSLYSNLPLRTLLKTANNNLGNVPGFGNAFQAPMANMSNILGGIRSRAAAPAAPAPAAAAPRPAPAAPAAPAPAPAGKGLLGMLGNPSGALANVMKPGSPLTPAANNALNRKVPAI